MTEEVITLILRLNPLEEMAMKLGFALVSEMTKDGSRPTEHTPNDVVLTVVSQTPGRVRFQLDALRHSPITASRIEERLCRRPGVARVRANPVTGSVLVLFDEGQITLAQLARSTELSLAALRIVTLNQLNSSASLDKNDGLAAPVPIRRVLEPIIA